MHRAVRRRSDSARPAPAAQPAPFGVSRWSEHRAPACGTGARTGAQARYGAHAFRPVPSIPSRERLDADRLSCAHHDVGRRARRSRSSSSRPRKRRAASVADHLSHGCLAGGEDDRGRARISRRARAVRCCARRRVLLARSAVARAARRSLRALHAQARLAARGAHPRREPPALNVASRAPERAHARRVHGAPPGRARALRGRECRWTSSRIPTLLPLPIRDLPVDELWTEAIEERLVNALFRAGDRVRDLEPLSRRTSGS